MGKVKSESLKITNYSTRGRKKKAAAAAPSPGLFDDSSVSSTSASAASNSASASKDLSSDLSFQHRPAPGAESTFDRLLRGGGDKDKTHKRPVFGKARSAFDVWRGGPDSSSSYLESSPSVVANANAGNASPEPSSPGLFSSPAVLREADINRLR